MKKAGKVNYYSKVKIFNVFGKENEENVCYVQRLEFTKYCLTLISELSNYIHHLS